MQRSWLIAGVVGIWAALSTLVGAATQIAIVVDSIQSMGGEQSFCPSATLQKAVIQTLSRNSAYSVQGASPGLSNVGVKVTGVANCSLGVHQRQNGFLIFQQRSTITTATVDLRLQLINSSTGATIATITEQGKAQSEMRSLPGYSSSAGAESKADALFEQAIAQALDAMLPQVTAALDQRNFQ